MTAENVIHFVSKVIDERQKTYTDISDMIWDYAELPYREHRSAELLCRALEDEGFAVTRGLANIPTAFMGAWGSGRPIVGILGEYDALPGLSQQAATAERCPVTEGGSGHGCGHNLLGAGSLAAAVAVKEYLKATGKPGTIIYYGTPAEEGGSGKTFMARDGIFDDLDFAYSWHGGAINQVRSQLMPAVQSRVYEFRGVAAHAGAAPHLGRSALDSCELMNVGANYLREHVPQEIRLHYAYLDAGSPAPNIVHDHAVVKYTVRGPRVEDVIDAFDRIDKIAQGAALMCGTSVTSRCVGAYSEFVQNVVLATELDKAFREIGAPVWDEADRELARKIAKSYSAGEQKGLRDTILSRYDAGRLEELTETPLDQVIGEYDPKVCPLVKGATDLGDVSYITPTAKLNVATNALGTVLHTWQMTAQTKSSIGHKGMLVAGKVMALATIRVMEDEAILKAAREEFQQKNGGVYNCPLPEGAAPEATL
ncbi:MAG: amidohydrolase [Clostridiales bacterium]|nr:amidohydrolase [Clostridiales bacterium]MDY4182649.1 amidohydrolase [Pseudoflavonifractor sp.]